MVYEERKMNSKGRDNRSRGRSDGRSRGQGNRGKTEFHKVKCDGCGRFSEVPFKPTKGKPVYCSECFKKEGSSSNSSPDLSGISRKLDRIIELLEER